MNLSDLRIFRAVVEEGGVTRAAERLHRVQSNVTTRVRQLEDELGVALFVREGKRLQLAPAGRLLLGYADRLLALAEEAEQAVRDRSPRGLFRLGAMESTAAVRLPAPMTAFHKRYPAVTLELKTGNPQQLSAAVLGGELDAAFVTEPVADATFDSVPAFDEALVLVAAADHPPLGADAPVPRTVLAFETGCPHRARLDRWFADRGALPERVIEMSSYHAMLGCIVVGMGVALVPEAVLTTFPERARLSVHPLPPGLDRVRTMLIWRRDTASANVEALVALLAEREAWQ